MDNLTIVNNKQIILSMIIPQPYAPICHFQATPTSGQAQVEIS